MNPMCCKFGNTMAQKQIFCSARKDSQFFYSTWA